MGSGRSGLATYCNRWVCENTGLPPSRVGARGRPSSLRADAATAPARGFAAGPSRGRVPNRIALLNRAAIPACGRAGRSRTAYVVDLTDADGPAFYDRIDAANRSRDGLAHRCVRTTRFLLDASSRGLAVARRLADAAVGAWR